MITAPGLSSRDFNGQLIKGTVIEVDSGLINASVLIQSGKRTISIMMSAAELVKAGITVNSTVFCLMSGKDITIITDIKEYMTKLQKKNPNLETYLVK
ncbi:hypothetical protein EP073_06040 [Geovibrio thiophilus]|uniref:Uncharacterized protein n=1 Tax=Geovibrio thiophilus TaxID=139438 RepID=A0A410JXT8_9BACT|nr:hypothetical protein [Geovibrio thiophilus]QAR32982.1 hypothetical protein EP073_06040 [Geovibrio thiophilus]